MEDDMEVLVQRVLAEMYTGIDAGACRGVARMLQEVVDRHYPLDALARLADDPID